MSSDAEMWGDPSPVGSSWGICGPFQPGIPIGDMQGLPGVRQGLLGQEIGLPANGQEPTSPSSSPGYDLWQQLDVLQQEDATDALPGTTEFLFGLESPPRCPAGTEQGANNLASAGPSLPCPAGTEQDSPDSNPDVDMNMDMMVMEDADQHLQQLPAFQQQSQHYPLPAFQQKHHHQQQQFPALAFQQQSLENLFPGFQQQQQQQQQRQQQQQHQQHIRSASQQQLQQLQQLMQPVQQSQSLQPPRQLPHQPPPRPIFQQLLQFMQPAQQSQSLQPPRQLPHQPPPPPAFQGQQQLQQPSFKQLEQLFPPPQVQPLGQMRQQALQYPPENESQSQNDSQPQTLQPTFHQGLQGPPDNASQQVLAEEVDDWCQAYARTRESEANARQELHNKTMDDLNVHLQGRRLDSEELKRLATEPTRALKVWQVLHKLEARQLELLLHNMRLGDAIQDEGGTWDDKWYDMMRLVRWIAAFAIRSEHQRLDTRDMDRAAYVIHNLEARKQDKGKEKGQPYSSYSWKKEAGEFACKRIQNCGTLNEAEKDMLIQAWRESGQKKNDAVFRKKLLEMKAMGL